MKLFDFDEVLFFNAALRELLLFLNFVAMVLIGSIDIEPDVAVLVILLKIAFGLVGAVFEWYEALLFFESSYARSTVESELAICGIILLLVVLIPFDGILGLLVLAKLYKRKDDCCEAGPTFSFYTCMSF